jgi:CSLREA domain-containing protein
MSRFAEVFAVICLGFLLAQGAHAAVYTVTKTADSNDGACDADCSLREAVAAANLTPDNDVIEFSPAFLGAFQTLTLSLGGIVLSNNGSLTINGPGANRLEIVGVFPNRTLTIHTATVNIHGLTFSGGSGSSPIDTGSRRKP